MKGNEPAVGAGDQRDTAGLVADVGSGPGHSGSSRGGTAPRTLAAGA